MPQRTIQEEQLRQLRRINAQLNPAPALLKVIAFAIAVLFIVFGLFGVLVQFPSFANRSWMKIGFFTSSCYPELGVKKDPRCR